MSPTCSSSHSIYVVIPNAGSVVPQNTCQNTALERSRHPTPTSAIPATPKEDVRIEKAGLAPSGSNEGTEIVRRGTKLESPPPQQDVSTKKAILLKKQAKLLCSREGTLYQSLEVGPQEPSTNPSPARMEQPEPQSKARGRGEAPCSFFSPNQSQGKMKRTFSKGDEICFMD